MIRFNTLMNLLDSKKMKPRPSMKSLQAFEATARHLSFSRAAEELCVGQSAISHQIKSLEHALNKPLFHRDGSQISLTVYGDALFIVANESFSRLYAITDNLAFKSIFKLKVMAQSAIAIEWLAPRLPAFQEAHPEIEVFLSMAVSGEDFDSSGYDIIVGTWPPPGNFVSNKLRHEIWYPVCAPSLYPRVDVSSPSTLLQHTLFSSENKQDWELWAQSHNVDLVKDKRIQLFSNTLLSTKAALSGRGIALSCDFLAKDLIAQGQLVAIEEFGYELPWGHFSVHYRENSHLSSQIHSFRDWLFSICH